MYMYIHVQRSQLTLLGTTVIALINWVHIAGLAGHIYTYIHVANRCWTERQSVLTLRQFVSTVACLCCVYKHHYKYNVTTRVVNHHTRTVHVPKSRNCLACEYCIYMYQNQVEAVWLVSMFPAVQHSLPSL